jgi:hypothetical protein
MKLQSAPRWQKGGALRAQLALRGRTPETGRPYALLCKAGGKPLRGFRLVEKKAGGGGG